MSIKRSVSTLAVVVALTCGGLAHAANGILILTDDSPPGVGKEHVDDLIAAFTAAALSLQSTSSDPGPVTVNTTALRIGVPATLLHGYNVVIVVTVTPFLQPPIALISVLNLTAAVNNRSSRAFMFFTDACGPQCGTASAVALLPIVNGVGGTGWAATLGASDPGGYTASLNPNGPYNSPFVGAQPLDPTIASAGYSPMVGAIPPPNVIYTALSPSPQLGPISVVAARTDAGACVFMTTDTTEFWLGPGGSGGYPVAQANGLAEAYLKAAMKQGPCSACDPPPIWLNKDFQNTTGSTVNDFEWLVQGSYPAVLTHYDGPYYASGNPQANSIFSTFTITPVGTNTLFHWSGAPGIPNRGFAHVGVEIPGPLPQQVGASWTSNGSIAGCAKQVSVVADDGGVTFINNANNCESVPYHVGNISIEYFATAVALSELRNGGTRSPISTRAIHGPPVLIPPGGQALTRLPPPPREANFMMVQFTVGASRSLAGPGNTTDYIVVPILPRDHRDH